MLRPLRRPDRSHIPRSNLVLQPALSRQTGKSLFQDIFDPVESCGRGISGKDDRVDVGSEWFPCRARIGGAVCEEQLLVQEALEALPDGCVVGFRLGVCSDWYLRGLLLRPILVLV